MRKTYEMASTEDKTEEPCSVEEEEESTLLYKVHENPPWCLSIVLGFQHYLTAFGSTITVPLILAGPLCVGDDHVALSELIATIFFVSGVATVLQTTFGIRLPIIQGATFAFLPPTLAVLTSPKWACPANMTDTVSCMNETDGVLNSTICESQNLWKPRMREIQGSIAVASIFQVLIGCSGLVSVSLRFIGPLTISPTITLIGLSLFEVAANKAATHWYIAITTMVLVALFSQYLQNIYIKIPMCDKEKKCNTMKLPVFRMFPVLLAMLIAWLICWILTLSGALPDSPSKWGYLARTDTRSQVLQYSPWFRVPYPGQWGLPTVSGGAVLGMVAGVIASMLESIGDYYACAKLSGAPPPPAHAINRGIAVEGVGCILAGLIGSGNGTTSYSENVGAIGITRVGSRRVVFTAGLLLIVLGCLGKIGALFVTIPDPVVGGMFMAMFGMITAVGISNLSQVNLNSPRNIFIIAFALITGLALPHWVMKNRSSIDTGSAIADQILTILLSTSMFVGGLVGFVLDNTIPGTLKDRGMLSQAKTIDSRSPTTIAKDEEESMKIYGFPFIQKYINKCRWCRYIPILGVLEEDGSIKLNTSTNVEGPDTNKDNGAHV